MGLLDYFKSYFPSSRFEASWRLGPNELPPNVHNDFENSRQSHPHLNRDQGGDEDIHFEFRTFHDIDQEFQEAFQQMDNMFKGFFGGGHSFGFNFPPGHHSFELPSPEGLDVDTDMNYGAEKSLRDKMLDCDNGNSSNTTPFHHHHHEDESRNDDGILSFPSPFFGNMFPFNSHGRSLMDEPRIPEKLGDQDLDNDLDSPSLDRILDSQSPQQPIDIFGNRAPSNHMSSAFKFSTITKKVNPDGSIETTSRKRDSEGNEEVTVTRNLGDQSHTTISKKNSAGEEEKVENFVNMEESDMEEFESKWKGGRQNRNPRDLLMPPDRDVKDWFSSFWKPKL